MEPRVVDEHERGGFSRTYGVELLYVRRPTLHKVALLKALRTRRVSTAPLDGNEAEGLLAFVHPDNPVHYGARQVPAQTFVALADQPPSGDPIDTALQQSWNFPEAREVVAACTTSVLVTDLMASNLPYRQRFDLFSGALLSVLEVAPADAIHWRAAQQIVDAKGYAEAAAVSDSQRFLAGAVNVRLFNVSGTAGDMLMDTLGLAALGLPDLQCHFRRLSPNDVARLLYNLGLYVFEHGDVIADGHTVEGVVPGSKWLCQRELALAGPEREVIDLDPGEPFAARS